MNLILSGSENSRNLVSFPVFVQKKEEEEEEEEAHSNRTKEEQRHFGREFFKRAFFLICS